MNAGQRNASLSEKAVKRFWGHGNHRALKEAVGKAEVVTHGAWHTFRYSFATHPLEAGFNIGTSDKLLGQKDGSTSTVYTHVLNRGPVGVHSPVDPL